MRIGIIGLGLLGGSIAKRIKKNRGNLVNIIAFDNCKDSLECALTENAIDSYTMKIDESFSDVDIIFLCTPVNISIKIIDELSGIVKKDCIITDVSSTKSEIVNYTIDFPNLNFIGGHPMTGSEKSGFVSSKETLFENAFYIVTPSKNITKEQIEILKNIIEELGAIYIELSADCHDKSVAIISHLPHIIASVMVNFVKSQDNDSETLKTISAGGFKDITRIASSSGELWQSIISSNKLYVVENLKLFISELENICKTIEENESKQFLIDYINNGKIYRDSFKDISSYLKLYDITVDVPDEPNVIGIVATILGKNNINIKNIGINNNRENNDFVLKISFNDEKSMKNAVVVLEKNHYKVKLM